jgi:holo-[acyl-carrier protein] synthase
MLAVGIDSVDIERFREWRNKPNFGRRIFSAHEIDYCLQVPVQSAERFATRFAAREAFFKALSMYVPGHGIPFLTVCRLIEVVSSYRVGPILHDCWQELARVARVPINKPFPDVLLSLTHTRNTATAVVVF